MLHSFDTDTEFNEKFGEGYTFTKPGEHVVKVSKGMRKLNFAGNPTMTDIVVGSEVEEIEAGSFKSLTALQTFDASQSSITSLGHETLKGCTSLKTISLPKTYVSDDILPSSDDYALEGTENTLENIQVDASNTMYMTVNNCLIRKSDGFLLKATKSIPYSGSSSSMTVKLPSSVRGIAPYAFYGISFPSTNVTLDLSECTGMENTTSTSPSVLRNSFFGSNINTVIFPSGLRPEHLQEDSLRGIKTSVKFGATKRTIVESPNYNSMGLDTTHKITAGSETFWWSYAYTVPGCYPCLVGDYAYRADGGYSSDGEFIVAKNFDDGYFSYPEDYNVGTTTLKVSSGKLQSATPVKTGLFISWINSMAMFIYPGMSASDERLVALYRFLTGESTGLPEGAWHPEAFIPADNPEFYLISMWEDGYEQPLWDSANPTWYTASVNLYLTVKNGIVTYVSVERPESLWYELPSRNVKLITIACDYVGTSLNNLVGMSKDCDRIESIVKPTKDDKDNIETWVFKNSAANPTAIKNAIKAAISDMSCNLLIFHFSGHGATTSGGGEEMCIWNNTMTDKTFWETIKEGARERCTTCSIGDPNFRIFCIFACCHAETMFFPKSNQMTADDKSRYTMKAVSPASAIDVDFGAGLKKVIMDDINKSEDGRIRLKAGDDNRVQIRVEDDRYGNQVWVDFGLLSWAACAEGAVSWMENNIGHDMVSAMVNRIGDTSNLTTYAKLWTAVVNSKDPPSGHYVTPIKHWIGQEDFSNLKRFR
jgi:hypothetical protein